MNEVAHGPALKKKPTLVAVDLGAQSCRSARETIGGLLPG